MISTADYWFYADAALDTIVEIVAELGDELANAKPDLPGANSPYAILTHCLGVMEFWGGHVVAGRTIVRDRPAEFRARGRVADLLERTRAARGRLAADLAGFDPYAPTRGELSAADASLPWGRTQGGALMHVYEELVQHLGQLEVTRDILLAPGGARTAAR